MVRPVDLPTAEPRWHTRRITAAEVVRLSRREPVPGVNLEDARVQGIQRCTLSNIGHVAFAEARRNGFLVVSHGLYHGVTAGVDYNLVSLWSWWCAAAGHPNITIQTVRGSDGVDVRCDISSTDRTWSFDAWRTIGQLVSPLMPVDDARWLFTADELHIDGVEMEDAIGLARDLVDVTTAGRFRPQLTPDVPEIPESPRLGSVPPTGRMERADGR